MDVRMVNSFLVFKGIIYKTIIDSYKCDWNVFIWKMYVEVCLYVCVYVYMCMHI